ncbi:MAG: sodium:calcium antiporter [Actinomycetota bacterium]
MAEGPAIDPRTVRGEWKYIVAAAAVCIPALLLRVDAFTISTEIDTLLFGVSILGAAFLLSWGAEVAQLDISQALAIAFLAFVAVLPEYAVDLVFAWKAGTEDRLIDLGQITGGYCGGKEHCRDLAIANMTGANRLLIGLGWAVVVLVWARKSGEREVSLGENRRTDLGFLLVATIWAFSIPIRGYLSLLDLVVLFTIFVAYVWHAALEESEHPELVGPPLAVAALATRKRRLVTLAMFVYAAAMILSSAEPFAHGLVTTGKNWGVSEFLLVQWLAPLASEAPEMIIAILFVLRSKPGAGLGTLVSSKVNQWSLLIATIPLVYVIARGELTAMSLSGRQVEEVFLTAAQSVFAIAVLGSLSISRGEAVMLLIPFLAQFGFDQAEVRYGFAGFYMAGALFIIVRQKESRDGLKAAIRAAFTPPWRGARR